MRRQSDLLDLHGGVAVFSLGEHGMGASLSQSLEVAARLLQPIVGEAELTTRTGVGTVRWNLVPASRFKTDGPNALYANMLRRYLQHDQD